MRMIHQLGQFLTRVMLRKQAHEYPVARQELEAAYKSLLGMSPSFIRNFSDAQLMELFGNDQDTIVPKCYVLGSLMKEEGEILQLEGNETDGRALLIRSLSLLLSSFNMAEDEAEPGHRGKISDLIAKLEEEKIPSLVKEKLFQYDELRGLK